MTDLERKAMDALLSGSHPMLSTLREQFADAKVVKRDLSGVGFFTKFRVSPTAPRLSPPRNLVLGDVFATVEGLKHGVGFLLFTTDGLLDTLEGYTFDDRWPDDARLIRTFYMRPQKGSQEQLAAGARYGVEVERLVETNVRDFEWLFG
jgi:hypothetical protein